jgi:hypothetical protein
LNTEAYVGHVPLLELGIMLAALALAYSVLTWAALWKPIGTVGIGLWGWSFVTRRVQWRDSRFRIARDGSLRVIEGT